MDNDFHYSENEPAPEAVAAPEFAPAPVAAPAHAQEALKLPEAHDKTTERIHELSNFYVSDYFGIPLLTKDIGSGGETKRYTAPRTPLFSSSRPASAGVWDGSLGSVGSVFSLFGKEDRMMFGAIAVMILGPLFFGAV